MNTTYHVSPAQCCNCPAKWFTDQAAAVAYAREAARLFGVAYRVWRLTGGRIHGVCTGPSRP